MTRNPVRPHVDTPLQGLTALALAALIFVSPGPSLAAKAAKPPAPTPPKSSLTFDGRRALKDASDLVALGPRPSGSDASRRAQNLIIQRLKAAGLVVRQDAFTASTPAGDIPMKNIMGVLQGRRAGVILIAAHYDTKRFKDQRFVGANDGGAGTAAVLELARAIATRGKPRYTYWFVLFDGEESIGEWSEEDSLYGSRHLVDLLRTQKLLGNVRAMILLDLIGDADLTIVKESNSYGAYRDLFWANAQRLGYGEYFLGGFATVADDHLPFVRAGVRAVNLIDFMYGGRTLPGKYWHTPADTMDKISPKSLQITGDVVLATLPEVEKLTYVIETRAGVAPPLDPDEERAAAIPPPIEGDVTGGVLESPGPGKPTRPEPVAPQRAP
jgi:glutaminyl-peptide cyclotransferase